MPRRFLALLCLALFVATGQLLPCACESRPVAAECADHDHRHEDPATERHCDCPTCHACYHVVVVIEETGQHWAPEVPCRLPRTGPGSGALPLVVADIFTPPKLNA